MGLTSATLATVIFTILSWAENPNGIFHDSTGTNWGFVHDTARSWFLPTFLYTAVVASVLHLVVNKMLAIFRKKQSVEVEGDDT